MITACPTRCSGAEAAGGVGEDHGLHAGRGRRPDAVHDRLDAAALVEVGAAEEEQHLPVADPHRAHLAAVPDGRRGGEAGQVADGDGACGRRRTRRRRGPSPEPMTTATSCGPPSAAVRSSAARAARAAGSVPGWLAHARDANAAAEHRARAHPPQLAPPGRVRWLPERSALRHAPGAAHRHRRRPGLHRPRPGPRHSGSRVRRGPAATRLRDRGGDAPRRAPASWAPSRSRT